MKNARVSLKSLALGSCALGALMAAAAPAMAAEFAVEPQSLQPALQQFASQGDQQVLFSSAAVAGKSTGGFTGDATPETALQQLLSGTDLVWSKTADGALLVMTQAEAQTRRPQFAQAADGGDAGTVEALIVTAQKREEDIQDVPIAISAFTQEQLENSQVAGGPDLMTQVPNMTFTKTNFSSYSIQIRGIGTQAISATTDPAVAVAFNNTPFIRNRFFEQEFYDLQRVEVLRGPQGTLYGRNATAGVVNIISAKPRFNFEAKLSGDVSNYNSTRLEGMVNLPLAEDRVALRIAGAWTKRDGYVTNEITGNPIDGRDLWSTRVSLRAAPTDGIDVNLIWEHFEENDDRLRSGKQLCHSDDRTGIGDRPFAQSNYNNIFSQGCLPASLYSPDSFEAPEGRSIPYFNIPGAPVETGVYPYVNLVQSRDLRVIESTVDPKYKAKSDVVELQFSFDLTDELTLQSETGYNYDTIFSMQDYNRFNTAPGIFRQPGGGASPYRAGVLQQGPNGGIFCDPQIGCADRLVAIDVSRARSRQFSQELRLSSDYDGPFNFSVGANFLRYDNEDKYYVFINTLGVFAAALDLNYGGDRMPPYVPGVTDNQNCLFDGLVYPDPNEPQFITGCMYMDPNPIESVNDLGHHYFLSKNPYKLISYAVFGEAYYNIAENLKVTAGLRWTVDKKEAPRIPSWVLAGNTVGYPVMEVEEQEWREPTGRLAIDWKPDLGFTDETMIYGSYARGYKAGGSNPPPSGVVGWTAAAVTGLIDQSATKPKTFDAEFVNAYEIGAKNTLLDGSLTLNLAAFYYDYTGYQISQIVDRSAVNYNIDAEVWGLEIEADWRPLENLKLGFKGGYENTRVGDGERMIDTMDRTAGRDDWVVLRPFPSFPSNCIVPLHTLLGVNDIRIGPNLFGNGFMGPCEEAWIFGNDPVTGFPYVPNPTVYRAFGGVPSPLTGFPGYIGYDPTVDVGQNNGQGFFKDLSGNELPNAPHFTATITADYTVPLPNDWLATLHTDLYYQSEAWTRIFNTEGYDKLKAFTNVNLAAIFTNEDAGWKVMAYVKNVLDRDSITGAFLNSDDTGLTTNVFLTEPRLYGLRVTKAWTGGAGWGLGGTLPEGQRYPFTLELGGQLPRIDGGYDPVRSAADYQGALSEAEAGVQNQDLALGEGGHVKLTYAPQGSSWWASAGVRFGKTKGGPYMFDAAESQDNGCVAGYPYPAFYCEMEQFRKYPNNRVLGWVTDYEEHEIVDFQVGRDFGMGAVDSSVSVGLRYATLRSRTRLDSRGIPDFDVPDEWIILKYSHYNRFDTDIAGEREFKGLGPMLSWDASVGLLGGEDSGRLNIDWSVGGGALFGKQKTGITGQETSTYYEGLFTSSGLLKIAGAPVVVEQPDSRSTSVTVPVVDLSLGLSYEIQRVKIGAGYRWERYFDALDVGHGEAKDADRTIDGPYLKLSVGFGG